MTPRTRTFRTQVVAIVGILALLGATLTGSAAATSERSGVMSARAWDACGATRWKTDGTAYRCSFVDRFDGRSVDLTKWAVQDTATTGFRMGPTCFTPGRTNVAVRSGLLYLTTTASRSFTCSNPYGDFSTWYTGGMLSSYHLFSQTYGRFEARVRFPRTTQPGLHGGFWLYPQKKTYGAWPASGEIDVAEWWSSAPRQVLPTLHYPGSSFHDDSGWSCTVSDASAFHTYAVDWSTTEMRFFIDGRLCFSRVWTPEAPMVAPQPFDHPFNIGLTMGVGGLPENQPSLATEFPGTFVVDYVKVWK